MTTRTLLITGATGKQGLSTINALLKDNARFNIVALTRNAQSESAQNLLKKSPKVKVVTGDFATIDKAFLQAKEVAGTPIWGVFGVQPVGKTEEADGKRLVDAALKHGVQHFVYTSVDRGVNSDTDPTNVPHFITKYNIEQHLKSKATGSNMTWTILRPVAFFDNLTPDFFGKVFASSMAGRLGKNQKLQLIGTTDIGHYASQAFQSQDYKNKSMALAADELSFDEMKDIFEKTTGKALPTTYAPVVAAIHWLSHELGSMFLWFREVGYGADVARLRQENPDLKDFATWLKTDSAWRHS